MSQFIIIGGDGKEYGPKDEAEIREWIRQGRLNALSQIKEVDDDELGVVGQPPEIWHRHRHFSTTPGDWGHERGNPSGQTDPDLFGAIDSGDPLLLHSGGYPRHCLCCPY